MSAKYGFYILLLIVSFVLPWLYIKSVYYSIKTRRGRAVFPLFLVIVIMLLIPGLLASFAIDTLLYSLLTIFPCKFFQFLFIVELYLALAVFVANILKLEFLFSEGETRDDLVNSWRLALEEYEGENLDRELYKKIYQSKKNINLTRSVYLKKRARYYEDGDWIIDMKRDLSGILKTSKIVLLRMALRIGVSIMIFTAALFLIYKFIVPEINFSNKILEIMEWRNQQSSGTPIQ
jgi:hypothetical protein